MQAFFRSLLSPFIGDQPLMASPPTALDSGESDPIERIGPFKPDVYDVQHVRFLLNKASKSCLPIDLIDEIIEFASYWPHVLARTSKTFTARGGSFGRDHRENVLVLRSPPICTAQSQPSDSKHDVKRLQNPTLEKPIRQVVWTIHSHDQGWSGEAADTKGTYRPSYTWFDAEIERYTPGAQKSQAHRNPSKYTVHDFLPAWERLPTPGTAGPSLPPRPWIEPSPYLGEQASENEQTSRSGSSTDPVVRSEEVGTADDNEDRYIHYPIFPNDYRGPLSFDRPDYRVQTNVHARRSTTEHRIVWDYRDTIDPESPEAEALTMIGRGAVSGDGRFVRALRVGDCVTLWAKARFPAWTNHVEYASVEIYFAV